MAFMGSWLINPYSAPEEMLKTIFIIISSYEDLYLWISHEHSNYFDKRFMKRIKGLCDKEIKLIIPRANSHSGA